MCSQSRSSPATHPEPLWGRTTEAGGFHACPSSRSIPTRRFLSLLPPCFVCVRISSIVWWKTCIYHLVKSPPVLDPRSDPRPNSDAIRESHDARDDQGDNQPAVESFPPHACKFQRNSHMRTTPDFPTADYNAADVAKRRNITRARNFRVARASETELERRQEKWDAPVKRTRKEAIGGRVSESPLGLIMSFSIVISHCVVAFSYYWSTTRVDRESLVSKKFGGGATPTDSGQCRLSWPYRNADLVLAPSILAH